MMSISGDLNAKALGAQKALDHVGTDDESANLDRNQLDETHGIETFPVPDERDKTTEKQNRKQPSRIEMLYLIIKADWESAVGNLDGKRRSKPTKHWLDYQTSQLEQRRSKLHSRIMKLSWVLLMNSCTHQELLKQYGSR